MIVGQSGFFHQLFCTQSIELYPDVFPWEFLVSTVKIDTPRFNEKAGMCFHMVNSIVIFFCNTQHSFAGNNIVKKIMITYKWSIRMQRITFLIAVLVYGQVKKKFIGKYVKNRI